MGVLDGISDFFKGVFEAPQVQSRRLSPGGAKIQVLDAIHPRKLCLGYKAWPTSIMWHMGHSWGGFETPHDCYTMVLAISDQLSGAIKAIWLDDQRYTVGTDDGSTLGADDFVPRSSFPLTDDYMNELHPANWYIPNLNKFPVDTRLNRHGRQEEDGKWRVDTQFKYYDGSQTAPDDRLEQIFGFADDGGSARNRVFNRITYLAITFRAGLSTRGGGGDYGGSDIGPRVPAVLVESEGNREVYDWRTDTVGYTRNGALCMAKWMMWEYGPLARVDDEFAVIYPTPANFSSTHMIDEANLCDEDVDLQNSTATQDRYTVDAEIEANATAASTFEQFSFALGGVKVFRRPTTGLWRIRCGRYNASSMDLAESDYRPSQVRTRHKLPLQERYNSIQTKYPRPLDGYEMVETKIVTDPIYLAADGGAQRLKTFTAEFVGGPYSNSRAARRAERLALIWLDKHRLEKVHHAAFPIDAGIDGSSNRGVIRAEIGDTVRITNARYGYVNQEFTVDARGYDPTTAELGFAFRETGSGLVRYNGDNSGTEEGPAGHANWWGENELDKVTNLTGTVVADSGDVQADGRLWLSVVFDWDNHSDVRVQDRGQYRLEYKRDGASKWSAEVSVDSRNQVKMRSGIDYRVRVRAETVEGRSDWTPNKTGLLFTPISTLIGPEGTAGILPAANEIPDPFLAQIYDSTVGDGLNLGGFVLDDKGGTHAVTGSAKVVTGVGYWAVDRNGTLVKPALNMTIDGDVGDRSRVNVLPYIPVIPGQIRRIGASFAFGSVGQIRIQTLLYDADRDFIPNSTQVLVDKIASGHTPGGWYHLSAPFQVRPVGGILPSFMRYQISQLKYGGFGFNEVISLQGLLSEKINRARAPYDPDDEETVDGTSVGSNYQFILSFGLPKSPQGGPFYANGDQEFQFEFTCDAQVAVAATTSAGPKTTWAEFRMMLVDGTYANWQPDTVYVIGDRVRNRSAGSVLDRTYQCDTNGTSAGSGGPTGTGTNITDGTTRWDYVEDTPQVLISKSPNKPYSRLVTAASDGTSVKSNWSPVRLHPSYTPAAGFWIVRPEVRLTPSADDGDPDHTKINIRDIRLSYVIEENEVSAAAG